MALEDFVHGKYKAPDVKTPDVIAVDDPWTPGSVVGQSTAEWWDSIVAGVARGSMTMAIQSRVHPDDLIGSIADSEVKPTSIVETSGEPVRRP